MLKVRALYHISIQVGWLLCAIYVVISKYNWCSKKLCRLHIDVIRHYSLLSIGCLTPN